jgi:hypothetical protein
MSQTSFWKASKKLVFKTNLEPQEKKRNFFNDCSARSGAAIPRGETITTKFSQTLQQASSKTAQTRDFIC